MGDITDAGVLRAALRGVEVVFHQAALPSVPRSVEDPLSTHRVCATGPSRSCLLDLVAALNAILNTAIRPVHTDPRPGDVLHSQADISRARSDLGYLPRVEVPEGLRRCVAFYTDHLEGPVSQPGPRVPAVTRRAAS